MSHCLIPVIILVPQSTTLFPAVNIESSIKKISIYHIFGETIQKIVVDKVFTLILGHFIKNG
jgi:hypothetical protein